MTFLYCGLPAAAASAGRTWSAISCNEAELSSNVSPGGRAQKITSVTGPSANTALQLSQNLLGSTDQEAVLRQLRQIGEITLPRVRIAGLAGPLRVDVVLVQQMRTQQAPGAFWIVGDVNEPVRLDLRCGQAAVDCGEGLCVDPVEIQRSRRSQRRSRTRAGRLAGPPGRCCRRGRSAVRAAARAGA